LIQKLTIVLSMLAAPTLCAEMVSTAMLTFPAKTESLEYDNLFELRRLPNYAALRQRFAGKQLDDAKAALAKLDIGEDQVHEIVMGATPSAFYGIVSGTFSAGTAKKTARKYGIFPHLIEAEPVFCPKGLTCIVFLEDSVAAFGSLEQLKSMLDARLGTVPRLSSNRLLNELLNSTPLNAPVRGVVYGSQLNSVIADALQDQSGMNIDWKPFSSNISAFGYSVSMDNKAHVTAKLQCKSPATAALLRQMLGALGGVQSAATKVGKDPDTMPFQNLQVSVSGDLLDLKMDTPIPTS
jgi:hypothetical protein